MATAKYYMDNGQGNQLTLLATKEISAALSTQANLAMLRTRDIISTNEESHGPNSIQKMVNNQDGRRIT